MLSLHAVARTWTEHVDAYVALSEFARSRFVSGGLPPSRIVVKPNFLGDDPGAGSHDRTTCCTLVGSRQKRVSIS
jgi:hypothetical protein